MLKFLKRYRHSIGYGVALAALLFLLQWMQYTFLIIHHAFEIYIAAIAILFTALGIWLALRLAKPAGKTTVKTIVVERKVFVEEEQSSKAKVALGEAERVKLGLSNREVEVLTLMAEGLSNQEIAERLFVSLNTIKTHTSKLFDKMEVKRRTQAIEMAKRLHILP